MIDVSVFDKMFPTYGLGGKASHTARRLRRDFKFTASVLDEELPDSREKSLAVTKLEEAAFWANAAIQRHEMGDEVAKKAEPAGDVVRIDEWRTRGLEPQNEVA